MLPGVGSPRRRGSLVSGFENTEGRCFPSWLLHLGPLCDTPLGSGTYLQSGECLPGVDATWSWWAGTPAPAFLSRVPPQAKRLQVRPRSRVFSVR